MNYTISPKLIEKLKNNGATIHENHQTNGATISKESLVEYLTKTDDKKGIKRTNEAIEEQIKTLVKDGLFTPIEIEQEVENKQEEPKLFAKKKK